MFAGYCWKIVRTTETGGTKLIYNGSPSKTYKNVERISNSSYINVENDETYPYTFNETNQEWVNDNDTNFNEVTFIFSVKEAGDYILNYNMISSESDWGDAYILMDDEVIESVYASKESKIYLNNLKPSNVIKIVYRIFNNVKISIDKGVGTSSIGCTSMGASTQIGESFYNDNYTSPAFSGYMYGTVYERGINTTSTSDLYGNSFTYSNGTYTLSDTHSGPDSTHHYTCFNTTDTCANIYYVYFLNNSTTAYYITLENGKSVEDAIEEMQENKTDSTL